MRFLKQFFVILFFTFLGEGLKYMIPLSIPASIYGLLLLFLALKLGILKLEQVKEAAGFLIEIMPVMFIPAAVGLIDSWGILKPIFTPVIVITVVTTVIVMVVSGHTTQWIIRQQKKNKKKAG